MKKSPADKQVPVGPTKRRRLSAADRRELIVQKAIEYFSETGFSGSTRELAKTLGVTQSLLYRYFSSKDELILAVYQRVYLDRWNPDWTNVLSDRSRPLRDRMQEFYEAYTDTIFDRTWIRIYFYSSLNDAKINRLYINIVENNILSKIIDELSLELNTEQEKNEASKALEIAWLLQGGIFYYGIRKYIYMTPHLEDKNQMIANSIAVFFDGVKSLYEKP